MSAHVLLLMEGLPYPFDVRVRAEVEALRKAGYEVTVAGPTGYGHECLEETLDGVRVARYRSAPGGRGALGYLREYATACLRLGLLMRRIHRERPVDLVFVCNPPDFMVLLALPLVRQGARLLLDYREICPELFEAKFGRRGIFHRLLLLAERLAFRYSDAVITVSEPCAEIARTRGVVDRERLFLVGNGPDPRRIFTVPARPELRRGRQHLVLWLGAMSRQEGLDRLLAAVDELVRGGRRRDTSFALVGPGDAHDDLREEVRRRGIEDFVEISGAVDDDLVRAYLSTADVCVNTDERNSMNDRAAMRKVLEYMAMGKAVVQFPLAEMRRLCGDATLYARNADARDLAAKIASLLDDGERRQRLGAEAQRRVTDGLMWPQQVPSLLEAVNVALDGPSPARSPVLNIAPAAARKGGLMAAARRSRGRLVATAAVCLAAGAVAFSILAPAAHAQVLFSDQFDTANGPDGRITNEWGFFNPGNPLAVDSPNWEMTSGSLFSVDGMGWTGRMDKGRPKPRLRKGLTVWNKNTGSAAFRLNTKRSDFQDVQVDVDVRVNKWWRNRPEPGIVIWMRYVNEFDLYWPSVLRREGVVDIEKKVPAPEAPKCPNGDHNCYNGGSYYILPPYTVDGWPVTLGQWYHMTVTAQNGPGSVTISTYRDGVLMESATDSGVGQTVEGARDGELLPNPTPAISNSARVGIRGDNADFNVANFVVSTLP